MKRKIKPEDVLGALTRGAMYTYGFDVSEGIIEEDIVRKDGHNFTKTLGLTSPCAFDEMIARSFGEYMKCSYTVDSAIKELSVQALLHAYASGKTKVEAQVYYPQEDQYVRLTYLLCRDAVSSHVLAYVICDDITELEKGKNQSLSQDNQSLKKQRDDLTREKSDLTEQNDTLTRQKHDLTEQNDTLTRQKNDLTEERDTLTREKHDLTAERDSLTKEKHDLTEERDSLTREKHDLTEERDTLTREKHDLTEERDTLTKEKHDLTAQRDTLTKEKHDLTEERDTLTREKHSLTEERDTLTREKITLNEALLQARLASVAKTSFLARMSHDIRTPMNGILGLIEINEKHADDMEFTSKNRKKAKVAADYLLSLINDVLQLSKLEEPNVTLAREAFDMRALTREIYTIIKMRAVEYGITLNYDVAPDSFDSPYVWGSPLHVRQIFINILSNAIKYNKKNGSVSCQVTTKKTAENSVEYTVVIADTGIGMSEEFLQHIFEPFTREHEEISSSYEGTGLGMSIVGQLVEKMQGSIAVESKLGEGSVFTVVLPFEIAHEEDVQKDMPAEVTEDISGTKVLLVEDNELNMEIAETFLEDAGVLVTKAYNGRQAVEMFAEKEPGAFDAILMDVMMPVMNGHEAARRIRTMDRPDAKTIPLIAMTANAFAEDIEASQEAGMNEHITKPLNSKKLIAVIAKCTKQKN